jgi:hypothetical protein
MGTAIEPIGTLLSWTWRIASDSFYGYGALDNQDSAVPKPVPPVTDAAPHCVPLLSPHHFQVGGALPCLRVTYAMQELYVDLDQRYSLRQIALLLKQQA